MWIDDELLVRASDLGGRKFSGVTLRRRLAAGQHVVTAGLGGRPSSSLKVVVSVAGPVIDDVSPRFVQAGQTIVLTGEGLLNPVAVTSKGTALSMPTANADGTQVQANAVGGMSIAPLMVQTSFGTATSPFAIAPDVPRGVVHVYDRFTVTDRADDGMPDIRTVRIQDDGSTAIIEITLKDTLPSDFSARLELNSGLPEIAPVVITRTHGSGWNLPPAFAVTSEANRFAIVAPMSALGTLDPERLGVFWLHVRVGDDSFPDDGRTYFAVRPVVAPRYLRFRSLTPQDVAAAHGATYLVTAEDSDISLLRIRDEQTLDEAMAEFVVDPNAIGIIPEPLVYGAYSPTRDPDFFGEPDGGLTAFGSCPGSAGLKFDTGLSADVLGQFNLTAINAASAWSNVDAGSPNGTGVKIIIADTGVNVHEELPVDSKLAGGARNLLFFFTDGKTDDPNGHGTKMASIAGAVGNNGGIAGVAPGAQIIPYRVQYRTGVGPGFATVRAMLVAQSAQRRDPSIKVLNFSLAESIFWVDVITATLAQFVHLSPDWYAAAAVVYSWERDVGEAAALTLTITASAGNSRDDWYAFYGSTFPATLDNVISVGNVDPPSLTDGGIRAAADTTSDPTVDVAAPGVAFAASRAGSTMITCSGGTSASSAVAAGAAAVLYSIPGSSLTPATVRRILKETATKIPDPSDLVGEGMINLGVAVDTALNQTGKFFTTSGRTVGAPVLDTTFSETRGLYLLPDGTSVAFDPSSTVDFVPISIGPPVSAGGTPFGWIAGAPSPIGGAIVLLAGSVGAASTSLVSITGSGAVATAVALPAATTGKGIFVRGPLQNGIESAAAVVPVVGGFAVIDPRNLAAGAAFFSAIGDPVLVAASQINMTGSQRRRLAAVMLRSDGTRRLRLYQIDVEARSMVLEAESSLLGMTPKDLAVANVAFGPKAIVTTARNNEPPVIIIGSGGRNALAGMTNSFTVFIDSFVSDVEYGGVLTPRNGERMFLYHDVGRIDVYDSRTADKIFQVQSSTAEVIAAGSINWDGASFAFSGRKAIFDPNNDRAPPWFFAIRALGF